MEEVLISSIATGCLQALPQPGPQGLSNAVWSSRVFLLKPESVAGTSSKAVVQKLRHFNAQNIGNTAWAYAKLQILDQTLMSAIASVALVEISTHAWATQELVNTAWAFAKLALFHSPLLEAISAAALESGLA
mmetsp:Transcript_46646/g.84195  ORF Transcript_46646/g.84195 Transcript_46646/m.84195 type:complete len:133 (-) Transcript_46646:233-631(-)